MTDELITISGLQDSVEIAIDRWGIPHVRAENFNDLFFGQGFIAARDRLWQIDLWRKRGLGLLAHDFGPGFLAQDRAARLFLFRGDMAEEWNAYGPDARAICEAFTAGINAYVAHVDDDPSRLPPEFIELGSRPSPWSPEDVVRIRTHGWMRNALSEVTRANVLACADPGVDLLRMKLEPRVVPHVATGIDLASIPMEVLDDYRLATTPVSFDAARLNASMDDAWRWSKVAASGEVVRTFRADGSNSWAIHGQRTNTGRPILANDPHRLHMVPSLRYLVHLTAPGLDVIGAVEPNFPGITIGHNGHAAWGLTLFLGPDQEDVYVYEMHPDRPDVYRYSNAWEAMRVVKEIVDVKGAGGQPATLKFTRHGPVIHEDHQARRAYALRSVWAEPGTAPYGGGLLAMRARSVDEFRRALRSWRAPAVNHVYADAAGDIAWVTAGLTPIRRNWDGLLPVPGDGRYEWDGFLDPDVLPVSVNPPVRFVASANAMNLPSDWNRIERPMGYEWDDPSRARRIEEALGGGGTQTLRTSCELQGDVVSLPARRLCKLLPNSNVNAATRHPALSLLRSWNHALEADSGPAALFELWWTNYLKPSVIERQLNDPAIRPLLMPGDVEAILTSVENVAALDRETLLLNTLDAAYRRCVEVMGENVASWSWGRIHTLVLKHAVWVSRLLPSADIGPIPLGGSESTVSKAAYRPNDFGVVMGASVRIVVDVGDWDQSVWINMPGQSGDPRSAHYSDLAAIWANGDYVPMSYTHNAVERVTERRIILSAAAATR